MRKTIMTPSKLKRYLLGAVLAAPVSIILNYVIGMNWYLAGLSGFKPYVLCSYYAISLGLISVGIHITMSQPNTTPSKLKCYLLGAVLAVPVPIVLNYLPGMNWHLSELPGFKAFFLFCLYGTALGLVGLVLEFLARAKRLPFLLKK